MPRTASWMVRSKRYTPTRARLLGGSTGFSTRRTTLPSPSRAATPKRWGSGTSFRRIWADGGVGVVCAGPLELAHEPGQVLLEQVVAQVHHEVVVAEELAGDEHAVGQAERRVLRQVRDLQPEARAVADGRHHLVAGVADDDADLADPGRGHGLQPVEQDRLVGHRHQLLGAGVGDGSEARAGAAREDQGLHVTLPRAGWRRPGPSPSGQLHCLSAPGTVPIGRAVVAARPRPAAPPWWARRSRQPAWWPARPRPRRRRPGSSRGWARRPPRS